MELLQELFKGSPGHMKQSLLNVILIITSMWGLGLWSSSSSSAYLSNTFVFLHNAAFIVRPEYLEVHGWLYVEL